MSTIASACIEHRSEIRAVGGAFGKYHAPATTMRTRIAGSIRRRRAPSMSAAVARAFFRRSFRARTDLRTLLPRTDLRVERTHAADRRPIKRRRIDRVRPLRAGRE